MTIARGVRLLAVLAISLVLISCAGSEEETTVPAVDTTNLAAALKRLNAAGLRAQVDSFTRLPPGIGLDEAAIGDQEPEPGVRADQGSVVRLTMGVNPIPTLVLPTSHPLVVSVPDLIGLTWPEAARELTGLRPQIVAVAPLAADKSDRGLDAFVVTSQSIEPGSEVPFLGARNSQGFNTGASTIQLELGVR